DLHETNHVLVTADPGTGGNFIFNDTGAQITDADASGPCSVDPGGHSATCPKSGVLVLSVATQDEDDTIDMELTTSEVPDHPTARTSGNSTSSRRSSEAPGTA